MNTQVACFDRERYLALQSEAISRRREKFGGKLYLEMGGKLFDDFHASRVLPGFLPDTKIEMLQTIREDVEIVMVVSAQDLARNKARADLGIRYDEDVLRTLDGFEERGLYVGSVVISKITDEDGRVGDFRRKLENAGFRVYRHYPIKGYPHDTARIVSEQGYGRNEYVETTRNVVAVTAPGPGSGKMATCLSQLYHDHQRGLNSGYAKFETFPIWNLRLDHPVNMAYEAATADLDDVNMIDPFHLAAYGEQAVNYNRDVEIFPVLNLLFERVMGGSPYRSPTDMGVNMAGFCIADDACVRRAAEQEVIRRYYKALVHEKQEQLEPEESDRVAILMGALGIDVWDRPVVGAALAAAERTAGPCAALQLPDGRIITGKTSPLLGASSAVLLNALKVLAGIDDSVDLLAPSAIEPIQVLKTRHLGSRNPRLHTDEVLIALSSSATGNAYANAALDQLQQLRGCDAHTTVILGSVDEGIFRNLGVHVTSEPFYQEKRLYRKR